MKLKNLLQVVFFGSALFYPLISFTYQCPTIQTAQAALRNDTDPLKDYIFVDPSTGFTTNWIVLAKFEKVPPSALVIDFIGITLHDSLSVPVCMYTVDKGNGVISIAQTEQGLQYEGIPGKWTSLVPSGSSCSGNGNIEACQFQKAL